MPLTRATLLSSGLQEPINNFIGVKHNRLSALNLPATSGRKLLEEMQLYLKLELNLSVAINVWAYTFLVSWTSTASAQRMTDVYDKK